MTRKKVSADKRLFVKFKGKGLRRCRFCGSARAVMRKYKLFICRRCFREVGEEIGFRKW
jgi:small subunit ribosomal protein S14